MTSCASENKDKGFTTQTQQTTADDRRIKKNSEKGETEKTMKGMAHVRCACDAK